MQPIKGGSWSVIEVRLDPVATAPGSDTKAPRMGDRGAFSQINNLRYFKRLSRRRDSIPASTA